MYYLLNFPRPIGVEPKIRTIKPEITPCTVEVEPGYFLIDSYFDPQILEFKTIKDALNYIIDFNSTDQYLK